MSIAELLAEHSRCGCLTRAEIEWFRSRGVERGALAYSFHDGQFAVKKDRVTFPGGPWFEFARYSRGHPSPVTACIMIARNCCGTAEDMVAWCPRTGQLATWLDRVSMLGEEQALAPRIHDTLVVHPDPLSWLRDNRRGIVIVTPYRAGSILRDAGPLQAKSIEQGRELYTLLSTADVPPILVPDPTEEVRG